VQGVIKSYDPGTRVGSLLCDTDLQADGRPQEFDLAPDALQGSILRMVRQGQRVLFEIDERGWATRLRLGSEVDMGTPTGLDDRR
jgi:CspA family cold shock protein